MCFASHFAIFGHFLDEDDTICVIFYILTSPQRKLMSRNNSFLDFPCKEICPELFLLAQESALKLDFK